MRLSLETLEEGRAIAAATHGIEFESWWSVNGAAVFDAAIRERKLYDGLAGCDSSADAMGVVTDYLGAE